MEVTNAAPISAPNDAVIHELQLKVLLRRPAERLFLSVSVNGRVRESKDVLQVFLMRDGAKSMRSVFLAISPKRVIE